MSTSSITADDIFTTTENLVETYGFRNRWTAKIYQWFLADNYGGEWGEATDENVEEVAMAIRAWVRYAKRIPDYRLNGVDFAHIAIVLCTG